MTIDEELKNIAKLTDINDHTGAMIAGCTLLRSAADDLKKEFIEIEEIRDDLGYLTEPLATRRRAGYLDMMELAERIMGDKFEAFRGAF